jgi:hypothetical protein
MGESSFEDLLPWLMQTLTSETSSVDRSGAAQGLSEVVGGLGVEKLHKLMPGIGLIQNYIMAWCKVAQKNSTFVCLCVCMNMMFCYVRDSC